MTKIQTDLDTKLKFNSFHASGLPPSNKVNLILQCTPICFSGIIFGALVSLADVPGFCYSVICYYHNVAHKCGLKKTTKKIAECCVHTCLISNNKCIKIKESLTFERSKGL